MVGLDGRGDEPFEMPFGPRPLFFISLMLAIGLFASWLGTLCWNEASQRLPTTLAGQLIVFETLAALAYAFALRGLTPEPLTLLGIGCWWPVSRGRCAPSRNPWPRKRTPLEARGAPPAAKTSAGLAEQPQHRHQDGAGGGGDQHRLHRLVTDVADRVVGGPRGLVAQLLRALAYGFDAALRQSTGLFAGALDHRRHLLPQVVRGVGEFVERLIGHSLGRLRRLLEVPGEQRPPRRWRGWLRCVYETA